jgi:hypothetical protein
VTSSDWAFTRVGNDITDRTAKAWDSFAMRLNIDRLVIVISSEFSILLVFLVYPTCLGGQIAFFLEQHKQLLSVRWIETKFTMAVL